MIKDKALENSFEYYGTTLTVSTHKNSELINNLGRYAFDGHKLHSKMIIPSAVTFIGDSAFGDNQLTEIVIKNLKDNVTLDGSGGPFYGNENVSIVYDPNYSE